MQCKRWTKEERKIKGKRKKQRGREGGGKSPQKDKESSRQENPDWGNKTGSQEKKIQAPDASWEIRDQGARVGGPSQRKAEQAQVAPSGCQGPSHCQTLGAGLLTSPQPGQLWGWGVTPIDCLRRQFSEARPHPPSAVAEDSGLGVPFHPAQRSPPSKFPRSLRMGRGGRASSLLWAPAKL